MFMIKFYMIKSHIKIESNQIDERFKKSKQLKIEKYFLADQNLAKIKTILLLCSEISSAEVAQLAN